MTSLKDRQRAAARARIAREMASRAEHAQHRRRRQVISATAAVAVIVVVGLIALIIHVATGSDSKKTPVAAASASAAAKTVSCVWNPNPNPHPSASASAPSASAAPSPTPTATPTKNPDLKNVGTPPATNVPHVGTRDMTISTNTGDITVSLDLANAPCAAESMTYLAGKKFFDNTPCPILASNGPYVLVCGDPSGKGDGGPSYTFKTENVPTDQRPNYPEGTVAMYQTSGENGSQFMIFYGDTPVQTDPSTGTETPALPSNFTIIGTVTKGLDVVKNIGKAGTVTGKSGEPKPKNPVTVKSITVSDVQGS